MDQPYRKDLSHLTWDEVYARQAQRAGLMEAWFDGLHLKPGNSVLDIGAGPGYVSFALAERVGPDGLVYALDRSTDALAYLEKLQHERGVRQIERIVGDAATLAPGSVTPDAALITMVLHHTDDPAGVLRSVARCLPAGAPVVIGEFHPDGPCEKGPPRDHRISPAQIEAWCKEAGLTVRDTRRQTPEHYMAIAERGMAIPS